MLKTERHEFKPASVYASKKVTNGRMVFEPNLQFRTHARLPAPTRDEP